MIDAFIFDMDGTLVDSEPSWVIAEIEVFATVGITLTPQMCQETTGLRLDAAVQHWFERFPWTNKSQQQVADEVTARVTELMRDAQPLPGVFELIEAARRRGMKMAICSSSPPSFIRQTVAALGLTDVMPIFSSFAEKYGKPHPAVYITTADALGVAHQRCLVFEDSINGAIAGKAAGMKVIAVPQHEAFASTRFDFCDAKIQYLTEFDSAYFKRFAIRESAAAL